jgi:hypothetical protein
MRSFGTNEKARCRGIGQKAGSARSIIDVNRTFARDKRRYKFARLGGPHSEFRSEASRVVGRRINDRSKAVLAQEGPERESEEDKGIRGRRRRAAGKSCVFAEKTTGN